ncbi:hypothetical protein VMCG_06933 [Cytospora schulzeri]|uniref:Phosphoglycerate mutase family protein n=1 Tax=Cytospora schulzeri TaxID=448051 RepID=A0A423W1X5_9PEZI|nr:hypothetical protein VMCG_06933 [Valsa malicola]
MRLFLVRHGESVDNVAGLYAGSRDSPLTNHGVLQARRLGTHLASKFSTIGPVQYIFSSNLQRAAKTAKAIAEAQMGVVGVDDLPAVVQLVELREKDFGSEEGRRFGTRVQSAETSTRPIDWVEPESRDAMKSRIDRFVDAHLVPTLLRGFNSDANHSVVVVAHGIILNVILRCLLARFGPEELTRLSRPGDASGRPESLASWSNTGYLEAHLRLKKTDAAITSAVPKPSVALASRGPSTSIALATTVSDGKVDGSAFAIHMTVQTVNCNHHLSGLKKTRGGIGSAAFDPKQKTMDSLFGRAAKKPRLGNDDDGGSLGPRG